MKHDFLVRPPHLNQAFEPEGSPGGAWGNGITRRSFIKRTGGATVASLVAWNLTATNSRAEEEGEGGGSGSDIIPLKNEYQCKQVASGPKGTPHTPAEIAAAEAIYRSQLPDTPSELDNSSNWPVGFSCIGPFITKWGVLPDPCTSELKIVPDPPKFESVQGDDGLYRITVFYDVTIELIPAP